MNDLRRPLQDAHGKHIALSYTWGDPETRHYVLQNDFKFPERDNSRAVFEHSRGIDRQVTIQWIDMAYINQESRTSQMDIIVDNQVSNKFNDQPNE